MLDTICIIADSASCRYQDLQNELEYLARFVISRNSIHYLYNYNQYTITNSHYDKYWTWPNERIDAIGWGEGNAIISKWRLSLCLNHLDCLKLIGRQDPNGWSILGEDDCFIPQKETFQSDFESILSNIPKDANIVWVSSGKKVLDCSFREVCGFDSPAPLSLVNNKFLHVQRSRYTDCILIKNKTAQFLYDKLLEHRIALPIDWEYNYLLYLYPDVKSYWLTPAIIQQNPKYI